MPVYGYLDYGTCPDPAVPNQVLCKFANDPDSENEILDRNKRIRTYIADRNHAQTESLPKETLVFTRIPGIYSNPNVHATECLIHLSTYRELVNSVVDLTPVIDSPPVRAVRPSPIHGLGTFALKDFEVGDLIVVERALAIVPAFDEFPMVDSGNEYPIRQKAQAVMEHIYHKRMTERSKRIYDNLYAYQDVNEHPAFKRSRIMMTNSATTNRKLNDLSHNQQLHVAIFEKYSRFNHKCIPNSSLPIFNVRNFTHEVRATRRIKLGEEIFTRYESPINIPNTDERRKYFQTDHGFTCTCELCVKPLKTETKPDITRNKPARKRRTKTKSAMIKAKPTMTSQTTLPDVELKWIADAVRKMNGMDHMDEACVREMYELSNVAMRKMRELKADGIQAYHLIIKYCIKGCNGLVDMKLVLGKERRKVRTKLHRLKKLEEKYGLAHLGEKMIRC